MTLTLSAPLIEDTPIFPVFPPQSRFLPVTYTPDDGVNLTYGEPVAFYPSADSPAGFDLDGEYYGVFDAFRVDQSRNGMTIKLRIIRQGDRLWIPLANVFKLRDADQRIPRTERD